MVVEASVPKGFKVTFPYPSEEAQPRCGVILVSVKRFKNPLSLAACRGAKAMAKGALRNSYEQTTEGLHCGRLA